VFEVSWSLLGKEPDAKPFMFHEYAEAIQFIRSEILWLLRDTDSGTSAHVDATEAVQTLTEIQNSSLHVLEDLVLVVGDVSYWVLRTSDTNVDRFLEQL